MSSAEVQLPPKPQGHHKNQHNINASMNNNAKNPGNEKLKKRLKHDRNGRRRSKSFSGCGINKLLNPKPVLPTKFLLGGNINDPLNLNSLQDEEINRAMNAVTPKSSPIPTPPRRKGQIEVIIPPNINDPLNLIDCADDAEYEMQLCSPVKKGRKKRLKKRRTISTASEIMDSDVMMPEAKTPECESDSAKVPEEVQEEGTPSTSTAKQSKPSVVKELALELLSPKKDKQKRKSEEHKDGVKKVRHSLDKIVSPVVPQPGAWLKRMNSITKKNEPRPFKTESVQMPQFKEKDKKFQYGNYNRYYGYRNPNNEIDHRLKVFSHHMYLFEGKDILDIGCNIGHVTLSVARDFDAKTVLGIDIDDKLISIARKNIKHYVKSVNSPRSDEMRSQGPLGNEKCSSEFFPISLPIIHGPIDVPGFEDCSRSKGFPKNVTFKRCNYILEDDSLLALEQPQFDTILCLSVTKWIHLNWGDNGLKQAFRRMYAQLRPGGRLVLEPQNWASYKGKKKLTETIFKHYNGIEFFPNKFTEYLLSPIVGFAKSEILGYPQCHSKGFRRPIQLFTKSTMFLSERIEATPSNITPNNPLYNDSLYQSILKTQKYEPQNSQQVEYIYSGILDRYCCSSEENTEANDSIAESFKVDQDTIKTKGKEERKITDNVITSSTLPSDSGEVGKEKKPCSKDLKRIINISKHTCVKTDKKGDEKMEDCDSQICIRTLPNCGNKMASCTENKDCIASSKQKIDENLPLTESCRKDHLCEEKRKELGENT
ncbi:hypothetical protein HHI36_007500 [Cryptolaemus montrouzieri]|uniref:RNA methyltransferase n=1 Tax=Cryptolaemus montrouzieri TaxID=559131 RepID=A0ABD2MQ48_9CUCU